MSWGRCGSTRADRERGCCSGKESCLNQRETVAWPIPTYSAMAVCEKQMYRAGRRLADIEPSDALVWPDSVQRSLEADVVAVCAAVFPMGGLRRLRPDRADERPDDDPISPPKPCRDC